MCLYTYISKLNVRYAFVVPPSIFQFTFYAYFSLAGSSFHKAHSSLSAAFTACAWHTKLVLEQQSCFVGALLLLPLLLFFAFLATCVQYALGITIKSSSSKKGNDEDDAAQPDYLYLKIGMAWHQRLPI